MKDTNLEEITRLLEKSLIKKDTGITIHRIPEGDVKTPDLLFEKDDIPVFVAELKTIEDTTRSKESETSAAANRISSKIYEAHKQLSNFSCPKVLILFNKEDVLRSPNLLETITKASSEDNKIYRLKNDIDLFIWIDTKKDCPQNISILPYSKKGKELAEKYFEKAGYCQIPNSSIL